MPTINTRLFDAEEHKLVLYNSQAVINKVFYFYYLDECSDTPNQKIDFEFIDYVDSYFRVFNERQGRLILDIELSHDGPNLIMNASAEDMSFEDIGIYYYEIGYNSGGYEQALRYGKLHVI